MKHTVYIVDDQESELSLMTAMLEREGFLTATFSRPRQALRQIREDPPDAVITDMAMPEMSGCDCFSALRAVRADVRVVLTSGLIQPEELDRMVVAGLRGFLAKPFRTAELSRVVHEAMTGD